MTEWQIAENFVVDSINAVPGWYAELTKPGTKGVDIEVRYAPTGLGLRLQVKSTQRSGPKAHFKVKPTVDPTDMDIFAFVLMAGSAPCCCYLLGSRPAVALALERTKEYCRIRRRTLPSLSYPSKLSVGLLDQITIKGKSIRDDWSLLALPQTLQAPDNFESLLAYARGDSPQPRR